MFQKPLFRHALTALLIFGSLTLAQTSCTPSENKEATQQGDQAYSDFQDYVATVETTADQAPAETEAAYNAETTRLKADFDAKVAAVDKYADRYDDARRQQLEQLRTRYTTAYDKRDMAWRNRAAPAPTLGQYYKLTNPAAQLTAANARTTYEAFVQQVKHRENQYDLNDWRNINAEWRALDEAYDQVKSDIPARDLAEIRKEKLKYAAFKSVDKSRLRAEAGLDAIRGEAAPADSQPGQAQSAARHAATDDVKSAGNDLGYGAAQGSSKVGHAVKGAYKDVKADLKADKKKE